MFPLWWFVLPLSIIVLCRALFSVVYVCFLFYCLLVLICYSPCLFCLCLCLFSLIVFSATLFLFGELLCIYVFRIILNCIFFLCF